MNGSKDDILHLHRVADSLRRSEALGLLPIIYANLNPTLLPSPDLLDAITDNPARDMSRPRCIDNAMVAISCLTALFRKPPPSRAALVDIWPRLRTWTEFFSLYESVLAFSPAEELGLHSWISLALVGYWDHRDTHQMVSSTPGVRRSLAAAWTTLLRQYEDDFEHFVDAMKTPMPVLAIIKTQPHLDELIEGCGGSTESLLKALKKHISLATASSNSRLAAIAIGPVLLILENIGYVSVEIAQQFLEQGIIASPVSALGVEGMPPNNPVRPVAAELGVGVLIDYLELRTEYRWTLQALRAGLLERVILWGIKLGNVSESEAGRLPELLLVVLRRILVFPSAIVKLRDALSRVEAASSSPAFAQSVLYAPWMALKNTVDERVRLLEIWKTDESTSTLACDNLQCERVDNKDCFRCCAGCGIAAYCSRTCQRADWGEGHRDECSSLLSAQGPSVSAVLRRRDKSFMCVLLHMTYLRFRITISLKLVEFLVENPDTAFFVGFDLAPPFSENPIAISVVPLERMPVEMQVAHSRKVTQSRGRVMLHVMALVHTRHFAPFVLRTPSSRFFDGLVELDAAMRRGTLGQDELTRIVVDLVAATNEES